MDADMIMSASHVTNPEKVTKLIVKRRGELEAEPDNPDEAIFFHPVPKGLVDKVKEGDIWTGRLGRLWDTDKQDVSGRKIFIRYFIPETLISSGKGTTSAA